MADAAGEGREEKFALSTSRHFPEWLASTGGGIAFTTYQAGKLALMIDSNDTRSEAEAIEYARSAR